MARHTFGQSLSDWTMDVGTSTTAGSVTTAPVIAKGPASITFWSAKVGGVQYTDLIDPSGSATDTITSSDGEDGLTVGAIPEFQGPDGVTEMWADGGDGRYRMVANDLGAYLADLLSTVASQQETLDLLANSPGYVRYNTDTSSWPDRPADSRPYFWIGGPGAPASIPPGDLWFNTVPA